MSKKLIAVSVGIFLIFILSLALISLYQAPRDGKPFVVLISREPDMIHPLFIKQGVSLLLYKAMFRGLVERDDKLKLRPILVKEVPTVENGLVRQIHGGKMEVTWRFRKGLKWSDGHPLTPDDVLFAHEVMTHPDLVSLALEKTDAQNIESMRITEDGYTLKVLWKKVYYNYLTAHFVLPRHSLGESFQKSPGDFERLFRPRSDAKSHSYQRNPVVNGPYTLAEWVPGTYIVLKANEHYHKKAKIPRIAFKIVKDVNSLLINLISGTGDACTTISPEHFSYLRMRYPDQVKVHVIKGMGWMHIDMNLTRQELQDVRVRKALLYGINRKQISEAISHNTFEVSNSWLPPRHYGYSVSLARYPYDPVKAATLLREAGWEKDDSQMLVKNKKPLKLTLMADSKNAMMGRLADFIKEDLRKLGVQIDVRTMPSTVWWPRLKQRDFDLALFSWYMSPRTDGEGYWAGYSIPRETNNRRGNNFSGYSNPEIDSIHKKLSETIILKDRLKLFKRHQEIWMEELPSLPLFNLSSLSASRKNLLNWKQTGSSVAETWNCEDWELTAGNLASNKENTDRD